MTAHDRRAGSAADGCRMDIDVLELSDRNARFILSGVTPAFANAIRRSILAEVPVMAIDDVNIYDNTSVLFDEMLVLRLAMIPIKTDLESYVLPGECTCAGVGCPRCQLSMKLSAEGPKMVYSRDLVSADPKVVPVDENIPIVELKGRQKLIIEAIARLGLGRDHARWQAGVACGYKNVPKIVVSNCDGCGSCVSECPKGLLKLSGNKVTATDELSCVQCKLCEEACEIHGIEVRDEPDSFVFTFETSGSLSAKELVLKAVESIERRADSVMEALSAL